MARIDVLKKKMENYLRKEQLLQNQENVKLEKLYLAKSRKNLAVATLLFTISDQEEIKKLLPLPADFEAYDWVMVIYYYAMYMAALAGLAKLGFKSTSHAATITALEYYYVRAQKSLDQKYLQQLAKAYLLSEDLISKLIQTKSRRETAQYNVTPNISREMALSTQEDTEEFISRIEEILAAGFLAPLPENKKEQK